MKPHEHGSHLERFYFPDGFGSDRLWVGGEEAHHLATVKRVRVGERVELFDGKGNACVAVVREVAKGRVLAEVESRRETSREPGVAITLAFAVPKGDRADFLVQKCAELGVRELIPLQTERSVVRLPPGDPKRVEKWRRVSVEASKQCGRNFLTGIRPAAALQTMLAQSVAFELALMASLGAESRPLKAVLDERGSARQVLCLVGPEGGFTEQELAAGRAAGCHLVTLGPSILRVETAAIAVAAMVLYALSDATD